MNWGLLALLLLVVAAVAAQNLWLRRRAEAENANGARSTTPEQGSGASDASGSATAGSSSTASTDGSR